MNFITVFNKSLCLKNKWLEERHYCKHKMWPSTLDMAWLLFFLWMTFLMYSHMCNFWCYWYYGKISACILAKISQRSLIEMNFYVSILNNIALKIVASKIKCVATDRLLFSFTCSFIVIILYGYLHCVFVTNLFFIVWCILMLLFCGQ